MLSYILHYITTFHFHHPISIRFYIVHECTIVHRVNIGMKKSFHWIEQIKMLYFSPMKKKNSRSNNVTLTWVFSNPKSQSKKNIFFTLKELEEKPRVLCPKVKIKRYNFSPLHCSSYRLILLLSKNYLTKSLKVKPVQSSSF